MLLQKALAGRPSKFDSKIAGQIIRAVREGSSFSRAAVLAGVHFVTIMRWRAKFKRFDQALRAARVEG